MSTSKEYIEYVCEQLYGIEGVTCKKMFGEFLHAFSKSLFCLSATKELTD